MTTLRLLHAPQTILILAIFVVVSSVHASNVQNEASSRITTAENTIVSAYKAVMEAESVGGNVTDLFSKLNEAGENLAVARMFYENGTFDKAVEHANSSITIAEGIESAAYELKNRAWNEGVQLMLSTMLVSVSGILMVVLGSFWVWRLLRRHYS